MNGSLCTLYNNLLVVLWSVLSLRKIFGILLLTRSRVLFSYPLMPKNSPFLLMGVSCRGILFLVSFFKPFFSTGPTTVEPCAPSKSQASAYGNITPSSKAHEMAKKSDFLAGPPLRINCLQDSPHIQNLRKIEAIEEKFVDGYDSDGKLEPFADLVEGKKNYKDVLSEFFDFIALSGETIDVECEELEMEVNDGAADVMNKD